LDSYSSSVAKLLFLIDKATNSGILPRSNADFPEKISGYAISVGSVVGG
jgi:hypothetical protein